MWMVVAATMVMVVAAAASARFPLDPPPKVEEVINRAREPERAVRVVPVDLLRLVELAPKEWVVQVRYRDHESLNSSILILQPYLDCQEPLLHLHPLVILQRDRSLESRPDMMMTKFSLRPPPPLGLLIRKP